MNAIYPGSFDPVTNGHINIARRSAAIVGQLIVVVLDNPNKTPLFSVSQRIDMLREVFCHDSKIEVEAFSGLLIDFAQKRNIGTIIRGVRGPDDLVNETPYATWNRKLARELAINLETVYLTAEPELSHVSSKIVKEVAAHVYASGMSDDIIKKAVPSIVLKALKDKYSRKL